MDGIPQILLVVALIVLPFGFLTNWWASWQAYRGTRNLVPYRERDCVGWGLLDMGLYVIVLAAIVGLGTKLATHRIGLGDPSDLDSLSPSDQSTVMLAFGVSALIATLLCLGWNWSRFERVEGFAWGRAGEDIQLGFRWFTMLVIPVLALQFLLNQWFPTHHPLVDMLQSSGDTTLLPVAAFVAVISAPIFEECFFRLFLQGWLEKLQITKLRTSAGLATKADRDAVLLGGSSSAALGTIPDQPTDANSSASAAVSIDNPYRLTSQPSNAETLTGSAAQRKILWTPILFSSVVFSLAHWSHGPDWVPLLFLAIGLGYLYQQTGRILPSIVVHFLVNALGIVQLWALVSTP